MGGSLAACSKQSGLYKQAMHEIGNTKPCVHKRGLCDSMLVRHKVLVNAMSSVQTA